MLFAMFVCDDERTDKRARYVLGRRQIKNDFALVVCRLEPLAKLVAAVDVPFTGKRYDHDKGIVRWASLPAPYPVFGMSGLPYAAVCW